MKSLVPQSTAGSITVVVNVWGPTAMDMAAKSRCASNAMQRGYYQLEKEMHRERTEERT